MRLPKVLELLSSFRVMVSRKRWQGGSEYFEAPRRCVVVEELSPEGMVKSRGELWIARSDGGSRIPAGVEVEVLREENLVLWVSPLKGKDIQPEQDQYPLTGPAPFFAGRGKGY